MRLIQTAAFCALLLATSARAAEPPIKIGVLNDMSSVYSIDGGAETGVAVQMAIDDAGLVLGQKAQLVSADHQNMPDVGSAIARRWYAVEQVDAIVDIPNSGGGFAMQAIAKERKKISLLVGAMSSDFTGSKCDAYKTQWSVDTYALSHVLGKAVASRGGDRWFFIGADYVFGRALVKDTSAVLEANGGKVLGSVFAPLNTSDFSSFLLQAQATIQILSALRTRRRTRSTRYARPSNSG
jgi:branched-chain amino acid transport system substrate-binding protein